MEDSLSGSASGRAASSMKRSALLLSLFTLAHLGHHLLSALPTPLMPMIRDEFRLDYGEAGLMLSAFSITYGIAQLPGGWLADRVGPRLLIAISISGVAAAGLMFGVSPSFLIMVVALVLMGALGGGYHPSAPPLIAAAVPPKNRGTALGMHVIGGSASFALAPLVAVGLASVWGWRSPFVVLAIPAVLFGIGFYFLLGRWSSAKRTEGEAKQVEGAGLTTPKRWRRLIAFVALSTFAQSAMSAASAFIPLYLVDHYGMGNASAGAFLSFVSVSGLWAGLLGGYLSDRVGRVPVILAVGFATGPAIYFLNLAPNPFAIAAVLLVIGVIQYVRMPVTEAYVVTHAPQRHRSMILAVYYFGAMEGSAVVIPLMGLSIDLLGFRTSFAIGAAAVFVVTLVCSLFLWRARE